MSDLFQSSTIPLLEQVVGFTQARHSVLAGNIANSSTPGYVSRDLSVPGFQERLKAAVNAQKQGPAETSPGVWTSSASTAGSSTSMAKAAKDPTYIEYHDQSQVGLEQQVSEMVKNRLQHNLALTIMTSQFRLLQTAISERV